ncbi:Endonuclease/exonuclease/phosphatase, partial [Phycomyces blakesleeanus]
MSALTLNVSIASLNCNSLAKLSDPSRRSDLIRFLRQTSSDIIALQETYASASLSTVIHNQFRASSSLWTYRCGLVTLSPLLSLERIPIPEDDRAILAKETHTSSSFDPFFVLVGYAPASPAARPAFYSDLQSFAILNNPTIRDRLFILGDFNFSFLNPTSLRTAPLPWQHYLGSYFVNCHTSLDSTPLPTFNRSSSTTTIDYIFAPYSMSSSIVNHDVQFISRLWTDHALLQATICLGTSDKGRGLWRAHPSLASNPAFLSALDSALTRLFPLLPQDDPQRQWEVVKATMIRTAKKFGGRYTTYRKKLLKSLQSKRSRFLRSKPILAARLLLLPKYDQQIAAIQQELVDTASLRAGLRWREHGETSAGYLKKAIGIRTQQQYMPPLYHPDTNVLCTTPDTMMTVTTAFYSSLFSPDPIDDHAVDQLL